MELDERFSKLAKDPAYKKIKRKDRKIKIDSRFEKMFTDERFHTKFVTDKRGKVIDVEEVEDLHTFYDIDCDDEDGNQSGSEKEKLEIHIGVGEKDNTDDAKKVKKKKKKKGKLLASVTGRTLPLGKRINLVGKRRKSSSLKKCSNENGRKEESEENVEVGKQVDKGTSAIGFDDIRGEMLADSSDSDGNDFDEEDIDGENIIHGWGELDDDINYIENAETSRLAVCNCDWDRIGANDLYILFNSFKPVDGTIKSVKIYPSDFGIERMKEEKVSGPKELVESATQSDEEHEEGSQFHMEKLREYQLNRLKYYYAVVECDNVETANKIYEELDGKEYEMSATRLDLRFIPNDTTFEREPKSIADGTSQLKNYEPANYLNTALQQTTVRLTWDEIDTKRMQTTMRTFTKDDVENMDFKDYLASSSEDEVEGLETDVKTKPCTGEDELEVEAGNNKEKKIEIYQKLMQEIASKEGNDANDEDVGMSFDDDIGDGDKISSFSEISVKKRPWQENEESFNEESDDDVQDTSQMNSGENDEDDDEGFNDPFFTDVSHSDKKTAKDKSKKKRKRRLNEPENELTEGEVKSKNELELLLLDESEDKKHFNLKNILEQEKISKSKKKRNKRKDSKEETDDFKINVNDPRFSALYSSHLYAIDPSEPNYKQTKATEAIIEESQRQRKKNNDTIKSTTTEQKLDSNLSGLLSSVKSKTKLHQFKKEKTKLKK